MTVLRVGNKRIVIPKWLPQRAVDPRLGNAHDGYWEGVANGAIVLEPAQLEEALEIAHQVESLVAASH